MKTSTNLITTAVIVIAFIGGIFYGRKQSTAVPTQLTLEQILSIRELHLVKHTYNDLFFMHKKNDPSKAIRAIVHVPVVVTAYINLRDVQLIKQGDSTKQIILPKARLNEPQYQVDKMVCRETRSFQVHVGHDLYSQVGNYLQATLAQRIDSVKQMAVSHCILMQAEYEAKEYVEELLRAIGRSDIRVSFADGTVPTSTAHIETNAKLDVKSTSIEAVAFGFLPL
ncbi:MAG TPA: DUF4230 domain-containing protein [Cyclobacteriaceae bacterium]|jgi:hypothetical protein|nr:DUF4230 domain-containing protein [Cyclobacteriaceae bacterium]